MRSPLQKSKPQRAQRNEEKKRLFSAILRVFCGYCLTLSLRRSDDCRNLLLFLFLIDDDAGGHHDEQALSLAAIASVLEEAIDIRQFAKHWRAELVTAF